MSTLDKAVLIVQVATVLAWFVVFVRVLVWVRRKPEVRYYTEEQLEELVLASNPATFEDMPVDASAGDAAWARYRWYQELLKDVQQGVLIPRSRFEGSGVWERYVLAKKAMSGGGMHN